MTTFYICVVGIGGFFGAIARYYISEQLNKDVENNIPLGTLTVNMLGSFLLGVLIGFSESEIFLLLIGTGFMGAFTTYSTFNKELLLLQQKTQKWIIYFSITFGGGILLAFLGYLIGSNE